MCCMDCYALTTNFDVFPWSSQQSARELHHCAVSSCAGCRTLHHLSVLTQYASLFEFLSVFILLLLVIVYSASSLATRKLNTKAEQWFAYKPWLAEQCCSNRLHQLQLRSCGDMARTWAQMLDVFEQTYIESVVEK